MKPKYAGLRSLLIPALVLFVCLLPALLVAMVAQGLLATLLVAGGFTLTCLLLLVLWLINEVLDMTKIVQRKLVWQASAAPDVAAYKIYFGPHDTLFDYTQPFVSVPGDKTELSISASPELSALPEGQYDFAVTAVDDAGNESDFAEVENVPLDVEAPAAPTGLEVVAG